MSALNESVGTFGTGGVIKQICTVAGWERVKHGALNFIKELK
jgi:hypothetical protein